MSKTEIKSVTDYIDKLPTEQKDVFEKLRNVISENIDSRFREQILYGMPSFVVPKSIFPNGYHTNPELPLPFVSIAGQKNYIALYHMGIYANDSLLKWFVEAYTKNIGQKPDMGKSCIRFKKYNQIPFELIAELMKKMNVEDWMNLYTTQIQKSKSIK